ncbi:extensin-like [Triticum dicoccoides]|uniref:extensin-like n=1 Tax=Triticum dicoccoides TaxID=85692 RepID=UPI00188ECB8E|nr:extensin-like [Triticum dicoccoides]
MPWLPTLFLAPPSLPPPLRPPPLPPPPLASPPPPVGSHPPHTFPPLLLSFPSPNPRTDEEAEPPSAAGPRSSRGTGHDSRGRSPRGTGHDSPSRCTLATQGQRRRPRFIIAERSCYCCCSPSSGGEDAAAAPLMDTEPSSLLAKQDSVHYSTVAIIVVMAPWRCCFRVVALFNVRYKTNQDELLSLPPARVVDVGQASALLLN